MPTSSTQMIQAVLAKTEPVKSESFYDPITGENITFDSDHAVVRQWDSGSITVIPYATDHHVEQALQHS